MVLACSDTVEEYIQFSGEAVRLAYWIGYRAAELSHRISGEHWKIQPWALLVSGKSKEVIESYVREFNSVIPELSQIELASRFSKASYSLVGPSHALEAFRSQYISTLSTLDAVHVYALYHGGNKGINALNNVLEDVKRRDILFPSSTTMKRPIWSCHDASLVDAAILSTSSPLEYTLRLILVDTADLYSTCLSVTNTTSFSDKDCDIVTVGPGANALLASAFRDISWPGRASWVDIPGALRDANASQTDEFAIVGMSVNFPLGAGKDAFWKVIEDGLNAAQEIPGTRFQVNDYKAESPSSLPPREIQATDGNFLSDPFQFDHEYFGISPREARSMDPQQKLLLQGAAHAMDDAGYVPNGAPSFNPETIGCYIGAATDDYVQNLARHIDVYYSTGTLRAFLSGKISYAYGWSGPSIVIDTACSSSLVSVVMACRALAQGDCTTALAGGVNVITSPDMYLGLSRAHFLSLTGQCKPFDISADGYCRAEGCGLFVIKRLSVAIHEDDRIYGVIKAAEINQSGNASSITHPHGATQQKLFQRLLSRGKIDAKSINAGDAIETSSIESIFGGSASPVYLTSVKGNIGHAEAASGSAGLAKLLMMLKCSKIPPQVGFNTLNPKLQALVARNIQIPTATSEWDRITPNLPRRALLNNFGAAGSNAALVVEECRLTSHRKDKKYTRRAAYNLILSAKNAHALLDLIDRYCNFLWKKDIAVQDICYTTTARRQKHRYVLSLTGGTIEEIVDQLQRQRPLKSPFVDYQKKHPIIFVISGQGSYYSGMGQQLMLTAPVFKAEIEKCDLVLQQNGFADIIPSKVLDGSFSPSYAKDWFLRSQVACFVLEYALACLWISWSIQPDIVIGHSLGEYAAMVVSGALPLQDALLLVVQRAKLMASMCQVGESTMLVCNTSASSVEQTIADSDLSQLTVACDNSVTDSVVSGPVNQVDQLAKLIKEKGIRCKKLDVPLGFHSSALDVMLPELEAKCEGLYFSTPRIPLGSCFYGRIVQEGDLNPSYPVLQTRGTVRFTELIHSLFKQGEVQKGTFIEVGPSPTTLPMVQTGFPSQDAMFLPSLIKGQDPWTSISHSLQQMSLRYDYIQWRGVFDGTDAQIVDLPDYPFQTDSLYVPFNEPGFEKSISIIPRASRRYNFHLLQDVVSSDSRKGLLTFSTSLESLSKYIEGHSVGGFPLCPASVYHEMVLEAMHYEAGAPDQVALVSDISFGRPLLYSPEMRSSTVHLMIDKTSVAMLERNGGGFTFLSGAVSGSNSEMVVCSGRTAWKPYSDTKAYLRRKAAYAQRKMKPLHRNKSQINILRRNVIYSTIFPRVVAYSKPYQSIKELRVAETNLDGCGTFEVPASALNRGIASPIFIDTMLHATGFIANSQAKPTDAFICSKVESTVVLYAGINSQDTFLIYCSLLDCGDRERIGEALAMTLDGTVVASIEGIHFKRLNLRSFTTYLSRQVGRRTSGDAPRPVVLQPPPTTKPEPISVPNVLDPRSSVVSLISNLCEQPEEAITPDKRLADLGIDSLLRIELSHLLKRQFHDLNTDILIDSETVQEIQRYIANTCGRPPGVSFANEESKKSNSDDSDGISTIIASGTLTSDTELVTTPNDMIDFLMQLVAETFGFSLSDIRSDMTLESLGMDSLMFIEFQEVMRKVSGKALTQDILTPALTINELAEELAADISSPSNDDSGRLIERATNRAFSPQPGEEYFLVHLQQGLDTLPPLILFHDGSGLIEKYKRLAKVGCNVFGVRNPDWTSQPHWARDLKDMARRYAAAIPSIVKAKHVVLGGWSFGGVLAHEVAQQLDKMEYNTLAVILIDSPCPFNHHPLPSQVVDYILGPESLPHSILSIMSSQFQSHTQFLAGYRMQGPVPPARMYAMLHSEQVLDTTRLCGIAYPWLESRQERLLALQQWEDLLGRSLVVYGIPGNHFEPFNDEYVKHSSTYTIYIEC
ncbi:beta-ketoacyl synthase [Aspergillus alliaceus]|uniref:beta-ketoacyl synthase n=1 Tax=Petromyces alliaceus TaxID=209559 RepID=UPI0012A635BF|nr:beta-ketoacyl synthase [Aspergillus alliaceus]KAB8227364.1 beta-ketoacyl synthase [Aspergillus alliaceus]